MLISTCLKQISTLCETTEFQVNSKEWCLCARAQIKDNQTYSNSKPIDVLFHKNITLYNTFSWDGWRSKWQTQGEKGHVDQIPNPHWSFHACPARWESKCKEAETVNMRVMVTSEAMVFGRWVRHQGRTQPSIKNFCCKKPVSMSQPLRLQISKASTLIIYFLV